MSQPIRRGIAVMGLAATLLLAVPAPSRAAIGIEALRGPAPAGFVTRAWSWLESLFGGPGAKVPAHRPAIQRKDGTVISVPVPPADTGNGQGSMIDPDGVKKP
jgi:hypothetical protein